MAYAPRGVEPFETSPVTSRRVGHVHPLANGHRKASDAVAQAIPEPIFPPSDLTDYAHWVLWRSERFKSDLNKVPYQVNGQRASTSDSSTWSDYETVSDVYGRGAFSGVGFVFSETDPFVGIDLDHSVLEEGEVKQWAREILSRFAETYSEYSPSGRGLKIFARGELLPASKFSYQDGSVEIYSTGRYFTVTGQRIPGSPSKIEKCHLAIQWLRSIAPQRSLLAEPGSLRVIAAGGRNNYLTSKAGSMRRRGMDELAILAALRVENETKCDPPLSEVELRSIATSVSRYEPASILENTALQRPEITIGALHLPEATEAALQALHAANYPPWLFTHGQKCVRIVRSDEDHHLMEDVNESSMRGLLARVMNFYKLTRSLEKKPIPPPIETVRDILSLAPADRGFPSVRAIVESPVILPNGDVLASPGYCTAFKLFYSPPPGFVLPAMNPSPTRGDACIAADFLGNELLADFAFEDQASRDNALAVMLLPIVRQAIGGPVPMALIDGTITGSGKGLLAEVASIVATGHAASLRGFEGNNDEIRKALTAALMTPGSVIIFDNVVGTVRTSSLERALTAEVWSDRILGQTAEIHVAVRSTFIMIGNNISIAGDLPRRIFRIRLDTKSPTPFLRRGWRHPDLITWTRDNRGQLLRALLTMARAWWIAGCPKPSVRPLGRFEEFTRIVGGILEFAGIDQFLANFESSASELDHETLDFAEFLEALHATFPEGFTAPELITLLQQPDRAERKLEPRDPSAQRLRDLAPDPVAECLTHGQAAAKSLGKVLRFRVERRFATETDVFWLTAPSTKRPIRWVVRKEPKAL